jgi:uncharacterized protein (TIRG00374 family)
MRHMLLLLMKAATSILLLYFSLRWVNVGVLAERLSRFEPGWVAFGFLLLTAQIVLVASRWREIATVCGTTLAFNLAFQITFIATFFNQVLPSTVGGDGANRNFPTTAIETIATAATQARLRALTSPLKMTTATTSNSA